MPQPMPTFDSLDAWPGEAARPPLRMLEPRSTARHTAPAPSRAAAPAAPVAPRESSQIGWLQRVRGALVGG
jgi:hypothetical protein